MSRIDPSIALQVRPPQIESPTDSFGKLLSLKNLMTQGQLQQQSMQYGRAQLEGQNLENAGRLTQNQLLEKQVRDQKVLGQALQENTKMDPETGDFSIDHNRVEAALVRAGIDPSPYAANRLKVENDALDHVTKTLTAQSAQTEARGKLVQSILNVKDPDLRAGVYGFTIKQAMSSGLVKPEELQKFGLPPQYPTDLNQRAQVDATLQQMADYAEKDPAKAALDRIEAKRKEKQDAQALGEQTAKTLKANLDTESQLLGSATDQATWDKGLAQVPDERRALYPKAFSPTARLEVTLQGLDSKQRQELGQYKSAAEMSSAASQGDDQAKRALETLGKYEDERAAGKENAAVSKFGAFKTATGPLDIKQLSPGQKNDVVLEGLAPGIAAQVKALAQGRQAFPTGISMGREPWTSIMNLVAQYDPSFDTINYNSRAKLRQDYTSGKSKDNIVALNTAINHAGRLMDNIAGLGNFDGIPLLNTTVNATKNFIKSNSGMGGKINKFNDDVQALVSEATRAWRQAGGSEQDIQSWKKSLSSSDSPSAIKEGLNEMVELLMGKVRPLHQAYLDGMNIDTSDIPVINRETAATLDRLGVTDYPKGPAPAVVTPSAGKPITPELMARARAANKGVDDAVLIKALVAKGYRQ